MSLFHSIKKIFSTPEGEQPAAEPTEGEQSPSLPESAPEPSPAATSPVPPPISPQAPYSEDIMEQRTEYAVMVDKLPKAYNHVRESGSFTSPAAEELIRQCALVIAQRRVLLPSLSPNDWIASHGEAYKRLAMICEKREDYEGAAEICLTALRDGATNDGSQSGMAGRLRRMLKKGHLQPTDEMRQYLEGPSS